MTTRLAHKSSVQLAAAIATTLCCSVPAIAEESGRSFEIYGFAQADYIQDIGGRLDPAWDDAFRPSKICFDGACGEDGQASISVKQSRFGVKGTMPTGASSTPLTFKFEFDLFGTGVDAGQTTFRLRHAYGEWGQILAGQTNSLFMDGDVFPNTIDYWGPSGMVFVRNPQLRITPWAKDGMGIAFTLEAPNSALDTGKITEIAPEFGAGFTGWTRLPDLTGSFRYDADWGHVKAAGILRQVGFQNTLTPDGNPSGTKTGYGLNLTGALKVFGRNQINAGFVWGEAIASYMNDGGVDLAPGQGLRAEAVQSIGWLAYYNHVWADNWSSTIGFSQHMQDNTAGQTATAFKRGSYGNVNLLYTPWKNVLTGLEFVWGELEQKDGQSATDYRLQFSTKVTF
jgi:hypothetical protein